VPKSPFFLKQQIMNTIKLNQEEVKAVLTELSDDLVIFLHGRVEEIIENNHGKEASIEQMDDILDQVCYSLYCEVNDKNN
jgi:CRISPR/Cas system-associated protein Cas7 (RAMP superfamily)